MADITQKLGFNATQAIAELDKLNATLAKVTETFNRFGNASRTVAQSRAAGAFKTTAGAAEKANKSLTGVAKGARVAGSTLKKTGKQGAQAGASIMLSWKMMLRVIQTQVLVMALFKIGRALMAAVGDAREFGLAIAEVATISGSVLGSQEALTRSVLALSNAIGKSAKDVAEGLYQTLSNQVGTASEAMGVLTVAMRLATVTGSETGAAVNAISSVLNSYGMAASEAGRISNTLFKTVELGRLRLEEIADVVGRVTPLAAKMGVRWEEVAASIAVMTRQGVKADTAITQMRAILQKLIKPTEKMIALFKRWGVADGPTAIKTFGGLEGVLRKLAGEVDHNDAEMAQLFSRVRAITAQMSTMKDGGQALRDVMKEIMGATKAATGAWEEFTSSDAYQLTKAINQLNNELLRSGEALSGLALIWTNYKRFWLSVLNSMFDGVSEAHKKALDELDKNDRDTEENILKRHEESTDDIVADLNKRATETRQIFAGINVEWNKTIDGVTNRGKEIGAIFKRIFKSVAALYKSGFSELSNFVKNAKSEIENASKTISSLEERLAGRKFDKDLKKWKPAAQATKLIDEAERRYKKAKEALSKAQTGPQRDAAEEQYKIADSYAARAESAAETSKSTYNIARIDKLINTSLSDRIKITKTRKTTMEANYKKAIIFEEQLLATTAQREEIAKRIVKSYADLDKVLDPKEQAEILEKIVEDQDALIELQFTDNQKAFMASLGLDETMDEVNQQITTTLAEAHFDWQVEIDRLSEMLKTKKFELRAEVVGGEEAVAGASKVLGREQRLTEGDATFVNQALDKQINLESKLKVAREGVQDATERRTTAVINMMKAEQLAQEQVTTTTQIRPSAAFSGGPVSVTETDQKMQSLKLVMDDMNATLQAGYTVSAEHEQMVSKAVQNYIKQGEGTKAAETSVVTYMDKLKKLNETQKNMKEQQGIIDEAEMTGTLRSLEAADEKTKDIGQDMDNTQASASAAADSAGTFTGALSGAAGVTTTIANGAATAQAAVERLAQAAVKALAAVNAAKAGAASATAFRGGKIDYLASGGRGQDTINAKLAPGEFVMNSKSTNKFFSELNAMNNGGQPVYREQGGSVTNVGDVNVTVQGGDTSTQTLREIGTGLRRNIRRGVLKLN